MKKRLTCYLKSWCYVIVLQVCLSLLAPMVLAEENGSSFHGSSLQGSGIGERWQAILSTEQSVKAADMQGKVSIYFFGFTHCPDVCPTTLLKLSELFQKLPPAQAKQLQVVMVSVDPERDTPRVLAQYLQAFDGNFVGITGSVAQIRQMARAFHVFFRKVPLSTDLTAGYTMEHSAQLFVFDKQGKARWLYYGDVSAEVLASELVPLFTP